MVLSFVPTDKPPSLPDSPHVGAGVAGMLNQPCSQVGLAALSPRVAPAWAAGCMRSSRKWQTASSFIARICSLPRDSAVNPTGGQQPGLQEQTHWLPCPQRRFSKPCQQAPLHHPPDLPVQTVQGKKEKAQIFSDCLWDLCLGRACTTLQWLSRTS